MADGSLTAKEFWALPPEERMKRCEELSDHEAFAMRVTSPEFSPAVYIPCNFCNHRMNGKAACKAFPDRIAPDHIKAVMADQSIPCANGFQFEEKEGE